MLKDAQSVSIIIPARNEEKYIINCLESLTAQTYTKELIEIIVVDGLSDDKTLDLVDSYRSKDVRVKRIINNRKYTPFALNMGIRESSSNILIILGAHSYVNKDFVEQNVKKLLKNKVDCVGGRIFNVSENWLADYISLAMACPFGVGNAIFRYSDREEPTDTVAFGAYKREVFNRIGYFDEEMIRNQDDEFNYRLTKSGGKILYSPEIKSSYYIRGSFTKLFKQYNQYGFWKVKVIKKIGKIPSIRHIVPSLFVLSVSIGIVGSYFTKLSLLSLLFMLGLYALLGLFFSYRQLGIKRFYGFPVMMTIFFILHFSYGIGFIEGLIMQFAYKYSSKKSDLTR